MSELGTDQILGGISDLSLVGYMYRTGGQGGFLNVGYIFFNGFLSFRCHCHPVVYRGPTTVYAFNPFN